MDSGLPASFGGGGPAECGWVRRTVATLLEHARAGGWSGAVLTGAYRDLLIPAGIRVVGGCRWPGASLTTCPRPARGERGRAPVAGSR